MLEQNQVYNPQFLFSQESRPDFPDGWETRGGDTQTEWKWNGPPEGPRSVEIIHPSGSMAGIIQSAEVTMHAGEGQRWKLQLLLEAEPADVLCYVRVYLGAVSQYFSKLTFGSGTQWVSRIFSTPAGVTGIRIEVGIMGSGKLIIHEVLGNLLYPTSELRMDEKGQIYVNHIDSLGQIQKPVNVRMIAPISVDVHATVTEDVRDLTPLRDGIRIYSSSGAAVTTTPDGALQTFLAGRRFQGSQMSVVANLMPAATDAQDVSTLSVYSFAIKNIGSMSAFVQLEISPDGSNWVPDGLEQEIPSGVMNVIAPNNFLRFIRLAYRSLNVNPIMIWFQGQS